MNIFEHRYSCRNFSTQAVPDEKLRVILRAAQMAPSACNRQPWTFYVVTNPEVRKQMLAKSRPAFQDAPLLIAAIGHHDEAWRRPADGKDHTDIDVAIAVEHICLAAAEVGLGSCWVCSFDTEAVRNLLQLTDSEEPIALIPIGFPGEGETVPKKVRKSLLEIVKYVE